MADAFILGGTRTPFGRYGGSLSHIRTDDLLGMTMRGRLSLTASPAPRSTGSAVPQ
jgi:acetyl-CoA acetyltransferase